MKNLKDIRTVAHHWANRVGIDGKASSLWFHGDTLHSYAEPIARLLPDGTVLHTTQSWSVTTSAHQSLAKSATNYSRLAYCRRVQDSPAQNMTYAQKEVMQLLNDADDALKILKKDGTPTVNARRKSDKMKGEALSVAEKANQYLEAMYRNHLVPTQDVLRIDTTNLEGIRAELKRMEDEAAANRLRQLAQRAEAATEHLAAWRAGNERAGHFYLHDLPVALRLHTYSPSLARNLDNALIDPSAADKQVIQTSHGAEIPVDDAKRLWPVLLRIKAAGQDWVSTNPNNEFKLGVYTLKVVRANGDIRVGCHEIAFSEIAMIAEKLDLTEKETT